VANVLRVQTTASPSWETATRPLAGTEITRDPGAEDHPAKLGLLELAKQHGNVCRFEAICCCPIWSKARFWIETAGSA